MTTSNVFYPGFVDDDTQAKLVSAPSDLWALVTGIASGTNYALRVSSFVDRSMSLLHVIFSTQYGLPCMRVDYDKSNGETEVLVRRPTGGEWCKVIVSSKVKYILKNLFEDRTGKPKPQRARAVSVTTMGDNIQSFIMDWNRQPFIGMRRIVTEFRENVVSLQTEGGRGHVSRLPDNVLSDICKAVFEDKSFYALQPETVEAMRGLKVELDAKQSRSDAVTQTLRDMFCRDKWLIGYSPENSPIIVASVNLSQLIEQCFRAGDMLLGNLPYKFEDSVQFDLAPRAYPTINHMDEQYRNAIQSSLTFLKVAVSKDVRYTTAPWSNDPDILLPADTLFSPDSGAHSINNWNGPVRAWLMVDK